MTSGTPDALLHKLRAAVVAEVNTGNDLILRQMAVARPWSQSAQVPDARSQNPRPRHSLAWIIARLGGWNCYYKPPTPKTTHAGWTQFASMAAGSRIATTK